MGHSKEHMLNIIGNHVKEMQPALDYSSVRENHLTLHEKSIELPIEIIREGFKWIQKIYDTEYAEYKEVRDLLSEEMWGRYLLWEDFSDHREVVMLNAAAKKLRKVVHAAARPNLFKKGKIDEHFKQKRKEAREARKANSSKPKPQASQ